ncbi:gamma-glutamylcyclotransferase family protein [Pseudodesulfovibrio sp.]|uniref:gamma-glutamylcyclotransferase family protein n=1 Tax=unclassified Pseudodesulfovibrio TaxID=2661612 RepID=UPI003B00B62A
MGQRSTRNRQHTIFVYGTMKRGFPNHRLLAGARYLGPASTVERYALYVDMFPGVYPSEAVSPIRGELFQVSAEDLRRLDALEGHPSLCHREQVMVKTSKGEQEAWIYFYPTREGRLIPSGEFDPGKELQAGVFSSD